MNVSLYEAASAMEANARWQETIAENMAASSIPGHKKMEVSFRTVEAGFIEEADGTLQPVTQTVVSKATNFSQGNLKSTGVKTDMALAGPGFFTVQLPDGTQAYTRDGEFSMDPFGQLITKQGYPVMGNGGPIQMDLSRGEPMAVSPDGDISQGRDQIGQLQVVEFADPRLLSPIQNGYFLADRPGVNDQPAEETTVRQGFLETSNTNPATEMTQLVTALRAFEMNQRIIQVQDERIAQLIRELGTPS